MKQNNRNKLELTWVGKDEPLNLEPRILIENPEYSYGDKETDNMIIHGDNLLALKALEKDPNVKGKVKCIYIDPPYNTGNAFEHYDDMTEHSKWLSLIKSRIQLLYNILSEDGVLFVSIDDEECHYLKIVCDEIFGRRNFSGSLIWEKKKKPSFLSKMGCVTEYILSYTKDKKLAPNFNYGNTTMGKKYPLNNAGNTLATLKFPAGSVNFTIHDSKILPQDMSAGKIITRLLDEVQIIDGVNTESFRLEGEWRYSQKTLNDIVGNGEEITISKIPFRPNHIKRDNKSKKMKNLLSISHYGINTYEDATKESISLFGEHNFSYPKPEQLVQILISAVTDKHDLVLDSFLGSGTTAAVAQKMGRKYIGIEMGNHAYTHCVERMKKVIDGTDQGGISKAENWKGGGGFKFYELASSLLNKDQFGQYIINKEYNADMLAHAMATHQGYTYSPDMECYWRQGYSSENDYIFTTTQFVTVEVIQTIVDKLGDEESLLICCTAYQPECANFSKVTIKKIPQTILNTCTFDVEGYPLNIHEKEELTDEE